jgi:hypothetical protein
LSPWPLILEKADTWQCDASHSHLDILYFYWRKRLLNLGKRCGADEFESENDVSFWRETITIVDS